MTNDRERKLRHAKQLGLQPCCRHEGLCHHKYRGDAALLEFN